MLRDTLDAISVTRHLGIPIPPLAPAGSGGRGKGGSQKLARCLRVGVAVFQHHVSWDPVKARSNRTKHRVTFEQAATVLNDPLASSVPDEDHSENEERWVTLGQTGDGMLLVVVHTYHEVSVDTANVRIISARPAERRERRQYETNR